MTETASLGHADTRAVRGGDDLGLTAQVGSDPHEEPSARFVELVVLGEVLPEGTHQRVPPDSQLAAQPIEMLVVVTGAQQGHHGQRRGVVRRPSAGEQPVLAQPGDDVGFGQEGTDSEPGCQRLGEGLQAHHASVSRERGHRGGRAGRVESEFRVRFVFHDQGAVPCRDAEQLGSAVGGHDEAGGVVERGIQVHEARSFAARPG